MNDRVSSPEDLEAVGKLAKNDSKAEETPAASYHGLHIMISDKKFCEFIYVLENKYTILEPITGT